MVVGNTDAAAAALLAEGQNVAPHPSGIPQDQIDNIMGGIAHAGTIKMNNHRKKLRQRFDIIKKLGQGTYGKVQLGINKETGQEVAIKTIKKCKIEAEADLVRIRREVQIMSSVQHPNIIHIYEVFENREKMVLVMEFAAGGELYDYLSERKVLSEVEARRIFRQVATAVYYCHKHKICHRDLKLENILLDEKGNAKIVDFGLSNVFDDQRLLSTFCGSPLYASPEIVEGTPYQGPEVDCWSLGVLLYTLVYGSMPFDGSNFKRLVKQIGQGDYYEPKNPSRASSLIREMLTVCPQKRATIEQICAHWWVNENDSVSCLQLAEDLANQTPVRLDVLLSLTPAAITSEQLVVPSADGGGVVAKGYPIPRSLSVGSVRDIGHNTEAERRILDMVAAGGEAALMPSPTRTITPSHSPLQTKRKLESTISADNVALKKKEKPGNESFTKEKCTPTDTEIVVDQIVGGATEKGPSGTFSSEDMKFVNNICDRLIKDDIDMLTPVPSTTQISENTSSISRNKTANKLDSVKESPEENSKATTKINKKYTSKHKTADVSNALEKIGGQAHSANMNTKQNLYKTTPNVRKSSLQDESALNKFNPERRKSRILETAEKFQQINSSSPVVDKPKKIIIPGVSVGNFKREFERRASISAISQNNSERRMPEQMVSATHENEGNKDSVSIPVGSTKVEDTNLDVSTMSTSLSLEDARRSMENSIALLQQAQKESSEEVNQLCAKTENISVSDITQSNTVAERERKLKNARAIIGNAIQPVLRKLQPIPPLLTANQRSSNYSIGGIGGEGEYYSQIQPSHTNRAANNLYCRDNAYGISNSLDKDMKSTVNRPLLATETAKITNNALAIAKQRIIRRLAECEDGSCYPKMNLFSTLPKIKCMTSIAKNTQTAAASLSQTHLPLKANQQEISIPSIPSTKSLICTQIRQEQHPHHQHDHQNPLSFPASERKTAIANINAALSDTYKNVSPKPFYKTSRSSFTKFAQNESDAMDNNGNLKTSTASITLKSATLPRRKAGKSEVQLSIKPPPIIEQPAMHFTTEMQHPISDFRSAPVRESPTVYSPIKTRFTGRASSLEPKEHIIPIQKPPTLYTRTKSNTTKSDSLSYQLSNDSESETTNTTNATNATNISINSNASSSQPIKKSPREFIIPIAIEGGGIITPREGSIEPSESSQTTSTISGRSTLNRIRPSRRIGSLFSEASIDEKFPFHTPRTTTTITRDADEHIPFTLHKLRSSRPVKKLSQDNDSQSSGEEDDDDGFEILTAENLFSTLLQRVRALTNRMNVNHDIGSNFPNSSRLFDDLKQTQKQFWNQDTLANSQLSYTFSHTIEKKQVRLNSPASSLGNTWRHSMSRNLGADVESMFSRSGATLPRDYKTTGNTHLKTANSNVEADDESPVDLADLDLSRLRLSKKDLETLSNITPGLPKCFQEQLLAKLPPIQARKLSRTLSVQNNPQTTIVKIYKRSQSGGRDSLLTPQSPPTISNLKNAKSIKEINEFASQKYDSNNCNNNEEHTNLDNGDQLLRRSYRSNANNERNDKPLYQAPTIEINNKYKYYSPYLENISKDYVPQLVQNALSNSKTEDYKSNTNIHTNKSGLPPNDKSMHRNSMQYHMSRISRPNSIENSGMEDYTSNMSSIREDVLQNQHNNEVADTTSAYNSIHHLRTKSLDTYAENKQNATLRHRRRSLSRTHNNSNANTDLDKQDLATKILQELQVLSTINHDSGDSFSTNINVNEDQCNSSTNKMNGIKLTNETDSSIGKDTLNHLKTNKSKAKATEPIETEINSKICSGSTIKKVKKISNKTEMRNTNKLNTSETKSITKESKLKRPKSYPTKELNVNATTVSAEEPSVNLMTSESKELISDNTSDLSINKPSSECITSTLLRESRLLRPKSYPSTKLLCKKDNKKMVHSAAMITAIDESAPQPDGIVDIHDAASTSAETVLSTIIAVDTNKILPKTSKKSKLCQPNSIANTTSKDVCDKEDSSQPVKLKAKYSEKKPNKGILYALGQKFEKLRDSALNKEKRSHSNINCTATTVPSGSIENVNSENPNALRNIRDVNQISSTSNRDKNPQEVQNVNYTDKMSDGKGKGIKVDKISRIEAMLRTLRERSIPPRNSQNNLTKSECIKRAVSVENIPVIYNRKSLSRVLHLFKRNTEKENNTQHSQNIRNTRSASNIQRHVEDWSTSQACEHTPTSPVKQKTKYLTTTKVADANCKHCKCAQQYFSANIDRNHQCSECAEHGFTYNRSHNVNYQTSNSNSNGNGNERIKHHHKSSNKDQRKDLLLNLNKIEKFDNNIRSNALQSYFPKASYSDSSESTIIYPAMVQCSSNTNANYNLYSLDNTLGNNNNSYANTNHSSSQTSGYRSSSINDTNRNNNSNNNLTPSFETITNFSTDSHIYQDDCPSTSTYLSPVEDADLYFDNWSVCSEDNFILHNDFSPTASRISRTSDLSSASSKAKFDDQNESMIDRIKRRSFYCRFNEKKPKRTSNIVGPNALRDYYREQATSKSRSSMKISNSECHTSNDVAEEIRRPLKLSPVGTELKPPVYKSMHNSTNNEHTKYRKNLKDIPLPPAVSCLTTKRLTDYSMDMNPTRYTKSIHCSNNFNIAPGTVNHSYCSTYNPKQRSRFASINGTLPTANNCLSSSIHGYATVGRRSIRSCNSPTTTLTEPTILSRDYIASSKSRSTSRYRTTQPTLNNPSSNT